MLRGVSIVCGATLALSIACSPAPEESAVARAELDDVRSRFEIEKPALWRAVDGSALVRTSRAERSNPIPHATAGEWLRDGESWVHHASSGGQVSIPTDASASVRVTAPDGTFVEFSPQGADRASLEWANGVAVYRGERTAFLRLRENGIEDYRIVASAAGGHRASYDIAVGPSARAVASGASIVVRDAADRPRLRIGGARVIDATGRELIADLEPVGCDWAPSCELDVRWPADAVYPVLVDPSWTWLDASEPDDFVRAGHAAVAVDDGVVIIGGAPENGAGVVKYTADESLVAHVGNDSLPELRRPFGVAALRGNGDVLFVGGTDKTVPSGDAYSIDPKGFQVTTLDKLSTPRFGAVAARLNDFIYVMGGLGPKDPGAAECLRDDGTPADGGSSWNVVTVTNADLAPAWGTATQVEVEGKPALLVVNGSAKTLSSPSPNDPSLAGVAMRWPACSIDASECSQFGLEAKLYHHAASALASGRAFVSGGISCARANENADLTKFSCDALGVAIASSNRTFLYEGGELHAGPMLRAPRQEHASAALANGYVLVVGGRNCQSAEGLQGLECSSPAPVAEICDPTADSCEPLEVPEGLDLARVNLTATAFDGGERVLVAYGQALETDPDADEQPAALFSLRQFGDACSHAFECVSGFCSEVCTSPCSRAADCADGLTCSAVGACLPLTAESSPECGCRQAGSERKADPTVLLLFAALLLRRRRSLALVS